MIINKETKAFQTRSDCNENWMGDDYYFIDDNSELAKTILSKFPNIEYVIENEEIVDVIIKKKISEVI